MTENNYFTFIDKDSNKCMEIQIMDIMYFESYGHDICLLKKRGKAQDQKKYKLHIELVRRYV